MTVRAAIYRPRHVTETIRFNGKLISCTESSLAMLADAVTIGAVRVSQYSIRAWSSEPKPDPASPGLNLRQIVDVAVNDLHIKLYDRSGDNWSAFARYLAEGRAAVVQLENYTLNDCQRSRVGHAIFVQARRSDGKILANNPLCTYAKWYNAATIRAAMTEFGKATGLVNGGLRFAVSAPVPRIAVSV